MKICIRIFLVLLTVFFAGCASVSSFKGLSIEDDSVYVSGVTPIKQDRHYSCGPACVAAVAAYWTTPLPSFRAKHPQMPENTTAEDLENLAREFGLESFSYQGSMEDLRENLRKGRPVIVMIPQPLLATGGLVGDTLLEAWNRWGHRPAHWVVVVGLKGDNIVIIDDPESGPLELKRDLFQSGWSTQNNLSLLIAAP